jgi:hypothetical protein
MQLAQSALGVGQGAAQNDDDLILGQRLQDIDSTAREQRTVDFEGRIFGSGADQANASFLDMGQEGILLGFVEAMNFIDEDDGPRAVLAGAVGIGHDLLDFLDPGHYGGELDEVSLGDTRNNLGESGLASSRRAPEDHRGGVIGLDLHKEGITGSE